jgi:hypothetical protein
VKKGMPGFSLGQKIEDKCGMRASMTAELVFDNVTVPVENLVRMHACCHFDLYVPLPGLAIVDDESCRGRAIIVTTTESYLHTILLSLIRALLYTMPNFQFVGVRGAACHFVRWGASTARRCA